VEDEEGKWGEGKEIDGLVVMLYVKATYKNCKKDFTAPKPFQTRIT
jgi:hypothetical protein